MTPRTIEEQQEFAAARSRRTEMVRDACALGGLCAIVYGVGMLSMAWALIVGGSAILGLSIWGAIRSDQPVTRNPK